MAALRVYILLLGTVFVAAPVVRAQVVPDSTSRPAPSPDTTQLDSTTRPSPAPMTGSLPELTVQASRARRLTATATTVLDSAALARSGGTVADLLASRTNLFVKQRGASGLATASMRGVGSSQTLVLVDGQRVADPQTGQTDLSLLPSLLIESARILHGSQAGRYGSGALGGVVRLQTRRPSAPLHVETTAGTGAYGWKTAGGIVSGTGDRWGGLLAVEGTRSTGDFSYTNEALVPTQTQRRTNAHRRQSTVFGRLTREGSTSQSTATLWGNRATRGLPGTANATTSDATQHDAQWRLSLDHRRSLSWGDLRLTARGQQSTLRFRNPAPDPRFAQADTSQTHRMTVEGHATLTPAPDLLVTTGTTVGYDQAALRDGVHRWRMGAYVDATWSLGDFTVHPALRLDLDRPARVGRPVTALSPQLGAAWRPGPEWLRLRGQVGRAFRTPTFNERFYEPGGNPSLRAEHGWNAEAGVELHLGTDDRSLRTELTAFTTRLNNQIVWQPSFVGPGLQVWRPNNQSEVWTRGVEWTATGRWRLASHASLNGRLSFAHVAATDQSVAEARAYGKQLPYTPRQRLKSRLGLSWRWLRLDVTGRMVGTRYVTADESQSLPPYHVVDTQLQAQHSVGPVALTAQIGVQNLLNTDYSVVRLYPMPPRHARIRLTLSFSP